ncbi:LuxR family transcriptional regulator [Arthrobacter sp. NPDC056886]|uniref:LuxR family transcriptional regulator n=1 Tax=Arthrobacter sp. NPDC056886 TaxID=3345960 RepID=UPI00366E28BC
MIKNLILGALGLFLLGGTLSVAPSEAGTAAGTAAPVSSTVAAKGTASQALAAIVPMSSTTPSPSGPVDPGTGESKEAKETRVDYAPYVIGAVVLVVLVASFIFWRKRRISHPRKPG